MKVNIGMDEGHRKEIANGLGKLLADTYTLFLKTQQFHWNVTGPHFQSLHSQFEEQYNELFQAADGIAERIRALGYPAPGSYAQFSRLTSIQECSDSPRAKEMVQQLVEGHETVARTARSLFPMAEKAADEVTLGLLTERLETHEKTAWMLRSTLEE